MNYYNTKTDKDLNHELNKEQGNQLFSRDINSIMSPERVNMLIKLRLMSICQNNIFIQHMNKYIIK